MRWVLLFIMDCLEKNTLVFLWENNRATQRLRTRVMSIWQRGRKSGCGFHRRLFEMHIRRHTHAFLDSVMFMISQKLMQVVWNWALLWLVQKAMFLYGARYFFRRSTSHWNVPVKHYWKQISTPYQQSFPLHLLKVCDHQLQHRPTVCVTDWHQIQLHY